MDGPIRNLVTIGNCKGGVEAANDEKGLISSLERERTGSGGGSKREKD